MKGNPGCKLRSEFNERERKKKKDYSSHQATVYELERYLLSSVPNQVLNSPSSQLNDACNRTRLQHGADRTTEKPEGHLDICSAARLTFTKRPESSFPLPSFFTFFFKIEIIISRRHRHQKGGTELGGPGVREHFH